MGRFHSPTSRNRAARALRWSILALVGIGGGMMLGEMVVGDRAPGLPTESGSYSRLSANPDALGLQGEGAPPCPGCADSYGVAVRMRAHRDDRMSEEFREMGAVDVDARAEIDPVGDYRFGGRFPDPEPRANDDRVQGNDTPVTPPAGDAAPLGEAPVPAIED